MRYLARLVFAESKIGSLNCFLLSVTIILYFFLRNTLQHFLLNFRNLSQLCVYSLQKMPQISMLTFLLTRKSFLRYFLDTYGETTVSVANLVLESSSHCNQRAQQSKGGGEGEEAEKCMAKACKML